MKIAIATAPSYPWGDACTGWHFVQTPGLGVIQERMPPGTAEVRHRHAAAQQFFYVLRGTATFELAGERLVLGPGEGVHVLPGQVHRIQNKAAEALDFLVISEPHAHGDWQLVPD
ncbi:cupin domain-containing protein [Hymenobacter coccineus]|uniref:Cupin n=1 Tax=Hymenobacter coccineus TaxID=1908235 RepID=A0A1G1TE47_9BACT|nr:cupin domain-containing protein [Hymenobacter coccineus]OGX89144.1 cupin [Hymenobacter coccineus]